MLLVAKSYADWESIGTAYEKNKKQYIQVINPMTGAAKEVRVYTEAEYKQMTIGSCTRCVKCGEFPVASTETMLCNDCFNLYGEYMEDRCRCSECGEFDWIEDMVYITDEDRYVCKECSSDLVGYCEWCQAFYSKDNVMYDEKLDQYICESCNSGRAPLDITYSDFLI